MPRPNRDRQMVSLYLGRTTVEKLDTIAKRCSTEERKVTRSDVIRAAVSYGLLAGDETDAWNAR